MVEKKIRQVIVPTLAYAGASMLVLWLFVLQETTVPISFLGWQRPVSITFLGTPLLAAFTAYYASVMVGKLLVGEAVDPISEGLRRLAVTSFLFFVSGWSLLPGWLSPLTGFLFYASILSMLHKTLSAVLEPINRLFEPILSSVYILFIGFIGSQAWLQVYPYLERYILNSVYAPMLLPYVQSGVAEPINSVIVVSTALVSVLALAGVFRSHPNVYLRYVGDMASGRLEKMTLLSFIVIYYFFFVRGFLLRASGINPQYVVVGEWAALCLGFYLSYRGLKRFTAESLVSEDYTGTWIKHVQQVSLRGEPEMAMFEALLDRFVRDGELDELVVQLAFLLEHSGLSTAAVTATLSPLINYRDAPLPRIGFAWQTDNAMRRNLAQRKRVINTVLGSIRLKPHGPEAEPNQGPLIKAEEAK